ncbi:hypothetical protein VPHK469_0166 [Vibrio phage K469]
MKVTLAGKTVELNDRDIAGCVAEVSALTVRKGTVDAVLSVDVNKGAAIRVDLWVGNVLGLVEKYGQWDVTGEVLSNSYEFDTVYYTEYNALPDAFNHITEPVKIAGKLDLDSGVLSFD